MSEKFNEVNIPQEKKEREKEVTFQPKSPWQKDDCINRSTEYDCKNESTIEAVLGNARVRCCTDEKCKTKAAEFAKLTGGVDKDE